MAVMVMHCTSGNPQILSARLGRFLVGQGSAKQLSLRLDVDLRTVENLRGGRTWPIARHWWNIWVEFGDDVVEAVFYPERVEARLLGEAKERERAKRQRLASAAMEDRSFGLGAGLGEGLGEDDEPLGPPNLDLFDEARP